MRNEKAIEELLAEMLRKQDQQTELLSTLVDGQLTHSKLIDLLNTKTDLFRQESQSNYTKLEASLARIENQLTVIVPMLEKALDNKERIERIENFLSEKFKFNKWIE